MKKSTEQDENVSSLQLKLSRDFYWKKLVRYLGASPLDNLLFAIWDVRQAQTQRNWQPKFIQNLHPQQAAAKIGDSQYFYPWCLETLANLAMESSPASAAGTTRFLDLRNVRALISVWRALRRFEDADEGLSLQRTEVKKQLFRLTRRQFEWQQGFWNAPRLLLYLRIFGGENARRAFITKHGVSLEDFIKFGFAVAATLNHNFRIQKQFDGSAIGIASETRDKCWPLLSATPEQHRVRVTKNRSLNPARSYSPSIFRNHPCVDFGSTVISPLVECIYSRISDGLYYDVVHDGGAADEIGKKFEEYLISILRKKSGATQIVGEFKYGSPDRHSPDIFVVANGHVPLVIEAKSKRLNARARFDEAPIDNKQADFEAIAKGCVQLWRFLQDSFDGKILGQPSANESTKLLLVCLDQWVGPEAGLDNSLLFMAHMLADKLDISQSTQVRKKVHFATVADIQ